MKCTVGPDELVFAEPVGRRWEIRATIATKPGHIAGGIGFLYGFSWDNNDEQWMSAVVSTKGKVASLGVGNAQTMTAPLPPAAPTHPAPGPTGPGQGAQAEEVMEISLCRFDGQVLMKVDGKTVFDGPEPTDPDWAPGDRLGLLCVKDVGSSYVIRDVRVRKLAARPEEMKLRP